MSDESDIGYECPICGKPYKRKGNLRRHILDTHDGVTYCDNCESIVPASLYCVHCKAALT